MVVLYPSLHPLPLFYWLPVASALEHVLFITAIIAELCTSGAVASVLRDQHAVSPLGVVPKKNKKFRLIFDLRELNKYVLIGIVVARMLA